MKTIYLIRDGETNLYGELTQSAIEGLQDSGEAIKFQIGLGGIEKVTILHSPKDQALKSAKILAEALSPVNVTLDEKTELCEKQIADLISKLEDDSTNILVSHAPDLKDYLWYKKHLYAEFLSHGEWKLITEE